MRYAIGDPSLVQFAVDSPENPHDFLELFDGMILMAGDPFVAPADTMNPPPQDGEIVDRYRHVEDLGFYYGQLSLRQMTAMSETLFANGLDFYQRTGAYGETLEKPFDFYADFVRTGTSSLKGGFYTGEGFGVGGYKAAVYEVALKRYPANLEIKALLDSVDRAAVDPSGDAETYFVYPTLTHGINNPPTISNVGNQTVNEDTATGAIPFTVADDFTAAASLTLAKSSSNTALVPSANIVFGGSGANRNVTVTPAANQLGTATITTTVSDGTITASDTFALSVTGTAQETWRFTHFATTANTGNAADIADPNQDGESNHLEFATGQDPNASGTTPTPLVRNGNMLESTYTRSIAARTGGVNFVVEWSDTLAVNSWSSVGVTEQILADNGTVQTVKATMPAGSTIPARFARLKVALP